MAEEEEKKGAEASEPSAADVADEAAHSAEGLRSTARWIAGAFAGIPSLAVIGALVRAPGDAGFEDGYLVAGVLLAGFGAYIGIQAFARVLAPVGLADDAISDSVMHDLPETRFDTYAELRAEIESTRDELGRRRVLASDASGRAAEAKAAADEAEAVAKTLAEMKGENGEPDDDTVEARRRARKLSAAAGVAAGESAIRAAELELSTQILDSYETQRRRAYGLQAGETVGKRFSDANKLAFVAVAFVAVGIIFLALAPKPKEASADEAAAASSPSSLVTLTLSAEGKTALGCEAAEVEALRVGGDDAKPTVIVLPGGPCPVRTVEFTTADPKPLGTVKAAEPVKAE